MKVLVAMSGGVDSAVAAHLLKKSGHEVVGANMRFWEYKACSTKARSTSCCSPEDMADAEKSAQGLGIPFYAIKMEANFRDKVIDPFINDYRTGKTPNPCVHCNTFIKFGEFYEKASLLEFDAIATGHYAQVKKTPTGRYAIFPAKDEKKDQAYYLYGLNQESLAKTLFPLNNLTKEEVRAIANKHKIPVAQKAESQEICFIPENNYRNFLKNEGVEFQKGFIRNTQGHILGKHEGKENFTIGQRKKLGIATGKPQYVVEILKNGDIIVGNREDLHLSRFYIRDVVFQGLGADSFKNWVFLKVQVRYNSKPTPALARLITKINCLEIKLQENVYAISDGQAGVLYDPEEGFIVAGGKISRPPSTSC